VDLGGPHFERPWHGSKGLMACRGLREKHKVLLRACVEVKFSISIIYVSRIPFIGHLVDIAMYHGIINFNNLC